MSCDSGGKKDGFTVPTAARLRNSLGQKLVPAVDKIRDINTQMGLRPYRVNIVRTRWSGGVRSRGVEQVISELEILPTPLVVDMRSLSEVVTAVGVEDEGMVQLQQISGRYTEEHLLGNGPNGAPPGADVNVYYEIEFFRRDGGPSEKRRFIREGIPMYLAGQVQWQITLVSATENRARNGSPEG